MQRVAFERVQKPLFGRGEPDETTITGEAKTVNELLPMLEAGLAGREWIAGTLSLADFALASTFMYRKPGRLGVEAYPGVSAWIARLESRPSWQKAFAPARDFMAAKGIDLG